jgi:hypothetical protein
MVSSLETVVAHLVQVEGIVLHFEIHKQFLVRIKNFSSLVHVKFEIVMVMKI